VGPASMLLLAWPIERESQGSRRLQGGGTVFRMAASARLPAASSACMHALAEHCIAWLGRLYLLRADEPREPSLCLQ
jgi:hypothetical protein